jgi:hypothetical protein
MVVVAQWAKAPGIHVYVAGLIHAVTPDTVPLNQQNVLRSTKKKKKGCIIPLTPVKPTYERNRC